SNRFHFRFGSSSQFTCQTHCKLSAPSARMRSTICRQAVTYRAGPSFGPPFHFPFQLNQFPFGSVPHSTKMGDPKFFASRAQARRSTSKSPAIILRSENVFSECL